MKHLFLLMAVTGLLCLRPTPAVQITVSEKGSLLDVPVREFSYQNLTLPQVLDSLSAAVGIQYGIVTSPDVPALNEKKSLRLPRTTVKGIWAAVEREYQHYTLIIQPRAVIALPKDTKSLDMDWLAIPVNFECHSVPPFEAAMTLLKRKDLVEASHNQLPAGIPGFKGVQYQTDADNEDFLITRRYQSSTPVDILSDLAFRSVQSWSLSLELCPAFRVKK